MTIFSTKARIPPYPRMTGPAHRMFEGEVGNLPAYPVLILLAGFPVWWALGATPFMPIMLAALMALILFWKRHTILVPGILPWAAFLIWIFGAGISIRGSGAIMAYSQRVGELVAIGIFMLYVVNARKFLPRRKLVSALLIVWATVVILGFAGMMFPEFRLHTPIGAILPGSLTSNELVSDLVNPPLAEVQQPWGAPEPYVRPSAPFPYANSWGVAFIVLSPVVFSRIVSDHRWWIKVALFMGFAASLIPALATSNRGMFIGLAISIGYVTLRLLLRRKVLQVAGILGVVLSGAFVLMASGAISEILGRQEYSDSTGGRLALYEATLKEVAKSPFLGFGSPRLEETIGVSLGTQGYVWMLAFCYGLVGLGLFCLFLVSAWLRTMRHTGTDTHWLHSVPLAVMCTIPFYSYATIQLSCVVIIIALLLRERYVESSDS